MDLIRDLLSKESLVRGSVWEFERKVTAAGERVYCGVQTSKWLEETEREERGKHGTQVHILPVIFHADAAGVTKYIGGRAVKPISLQLGNGRREVINSDEAKRVAAYVPVLAASQAVRSKDAYKTEKAALYQFIITQVFQDLMTVHADGGFEHDVPGCGWQAHGWACVQLA